MKFDHIGYAVKDIEKAKRQMKALGYRFEDTIEDGDRNIYLAFGEMDGVRVELVAPARCGASPVDGYLSQTGPAPYHICYKSDDFEADLERLGKNRFKVSVPPAPAAAFGNKKVVFLYSLTVGLIEIVED